MTLIVADITTDIPFLLGDVSVAYSGREGERDLEYILQNHNNHIDSLQQKIIIINSNLALGGAGDAITIKRFINYILDNRNRIDDFPSFERVVETYTPYEDNTSEIVGIFSNENDTKAIYVKLSNDISHIMNVECHEYISIGSGKSIYDAKVGKLSELSSISSKKNNLPDEKILSIINNLMLEDQGTHENQKNGFGFFYNAVLYERDCFRYVSNYAALHVKFTIYPDSEGNLGANRSLGTEKGKGYFLSVYREGDRQFIEEVKENRNEVRVWEIPPLLEDVDSNAEIFHPRINSCIRIKEAKFFLLCADVSYKLEGSDSVKVVPSTGLWETEKFSMEIEDCAEKKFPDYFCVGLNILPVIDKSVDSMKNIV